jgi:hypothetical protein
MNHNGQELTFEEADRRYAELKRQHDSGALSYESFAAHLRDLMVQGDDGHWWSKSPTTGNWHYHDGEKWVKSTPPHYEPSPPPPEETTSTDVSQPERTDLPSSGDRAQDDTLTSTQTDRTDEEQGETGGGSGWRSATIWGLGVLALFVFLAIIGALADTGVSPPPDPGDIFQDDFESVSKNWDLEKTDDYPIKYADGALSIRTVPNAGVAKLKGRVRGDVLKVEDVIVEADATQVSDNTSGETAWGLICRAKDLDNLYAALLFSHGVATILKQENGKWEKLGSGNASDAFDGDTATNHIRLDCVGNTLTMYINDQEGAEAEDSSFASGKFGLYVQNNTDSTAEVSFDNLLVSRP